MSTIPKPPTPSPLRPVRVRYLLLLDLLLSPIALLLAITLRFESYPSVVEYLLHQGGWALLLISPVVRLPLYAYFNLYNRLWRYAGSHELHGILRAGVVAPLLIGLVNFGALPLLGLPYSASRAIWLLEAVCSLGALAGLRLALRALSNRRSHPTEGMAGGAQTPTLIVGAGDAGAMLLRGLQQHPRFGMDVVGFLDDDPDKQDSVLLGVPVLGPCDSLPEYIDELSVREVFIAMPRASGKAIRAVVQMCKAAQIRPRFVPSLQALVNSHDLLAQVRPVEIDDLLRRAPIATDEVGVHALLAGKRVLVTGGGGSIGRELCRQILRANPASLALLGHGENSIFEIEQELRQMILRLGLTTRLQAYIADIRMAERIRLAFVEYQPQVVFHAAAHKHVPLMEANPGEAVINNVLGTANVLAAAQAAHVEQFVMVSTDKAVNPANVMGATKRAAELLVLETARRTGKPYVAVRFGNVLGSRGSVVLTFKRQIAAGGPVTVTDPNVRRYFMTIPEAVQLVLQAAVLGRGGEVFMLDMGEPVAILDLARDLIRLSGLEEGRDIDIVFTGLRPGEKLFEELFLPGETYHTTAHPKIRAAANAVAQVPADLDALIQVLGQAAQQGEPEKVRAALYMLVPEYQAATQPASPAQLSVGPAQRQVQYTPVESGASD